MPRRHSPPPGGSGQTAETLKRPTAKKSEESSGGLQDLAEVGPGSLTPSATQVPPPSPRKAPGPASLSPSETPAGSPSATAPSQTESNSDNSGPPTRTDKGLFVINGIEFHHESEAEFARLLNYYGIEWQYEPHQFPLRWHEGRPTEMFSPDFYLTEYDLYIELTTMRQSLVRRKNRKLRLLRALYPEINIKLLYRRDYQRLLERFGIKPDEYEAERPPQELPASED